MTSLTIKLYRGEDIRRFKIELSSNALESLDQLQNRVISTFGFQSVEDYVLKFKDDEGDLCTIQRSDELLEAVRLTEGNIMRLWVFAPKQATTTTPPQQKSSDGSKNNAGKQIPECLDSILKAFNISETDVEKCVNGTDITKVLEIPAVATFANVFRNGCHPPQPNRCGGRQNRGPCGFRKRNKGNPIHWGVECDVSGMNPIVGNRYHRKGDNYDLCESEFQKLEDDQKSTYELIRFPGSQPEAAVSEKLCARFVQDVTVFDGTQVLPETTLTKIWRVRNTGKTEWPEGTTLEHVGGDQLGSTNSVPVPTAQPGEEVDVSIDLVSPNAEGRHVGYYRLRGPGPNGRRFGQRIWVMIQVVSQKSFESNDVEESALEEFKPEREEVDDVVPPASKTDEVQPQTSKTEELTVEDDGKENRVDEDNEIPALESAEEENTLTSSGSSDDFVDVKDDSNLLAVKLSDICKIKVEEAEEFLTKSDSVLVQAMIDNDLLRDLRSAVAVALRGDEESKTETKKPSEESEVVSNDNGLEKTTSSASSSASSQSNEFIVAMNCLREMGFKGPNVEAELKRNNLKIEDTVKALLAHLT